MDGVQGGGEEDMSFLSKGKMGRDFCPNFLHPLLENVHGSSDNEGGRGLIPMFHNPYRKGYKALGDH